MKSRLDTTRHFLLKQEFKTPIKAISTITHHVYNNADNLLVLLTGVFWDFFKTANIENSTDFFLIPIILKYSILYRSFMCIVGGGALLIFVLPPPKNEDIFGDFLTKAYLVFCSLTTLTLVLVRLPVAFYAKDGLQVFSILFVSIISFFIRRRWASKL